MPGSQSGCTCTRVCMRTCVVCARARRWRASRTRSRCRARTGTRSRARLAVCCCRRRGAGRRKHPWVCTSACCRPYRRSTTGGAYCGRACGAGLRQIPRVCTPAQPTAYHPVNTGCTCGSSLWPIPRARTPVWQEVAVYRTVCTGAPVVLSWGEPPGYTPVCCPHAGFDTKLGPPSSPFDAHSTN